MIVTLMKKPSISSIGLANNISAAILVLVPFHAFLTVFGSTLIGHYTLLRLWDDLLLLALATIVVWWIIMLPHLRAQLFGNLLFRIIGLYVLLTLSLGFVALIKHEVALKALGFSWVVNLRFLVWFVVVYMVAIRSDWLRTKWRPIVFWPALIVCVFALLQFFFLSPKFLAHFGYDSLKNVAPVTTINQSTNTIRVQSFLRGPNPLGAYIVLLLGVTLAFIGPFHKDRRKWLLGALAAATLALTFSRSAWIGAITVVIGITLLRVKSKRARLKIGIILAAVLAVGTIGVLVFSKNSGVQNAFLHTTPESHIKDTSNQGHSTALREGLHDVIHEPFGRGPGTAGPSSIYNSPHQPRNSENYFLEIGQETGWTGLLLYATVTVITALELWRHRYDKLALGLFVGLIGLIIVSQFAYAWTDDTLAYVWWGLAGIALAKPLSKPRRS